MQKLWLFFKTYWAVLGLICLAGGVFFAGFKPGTWLLGWDNLVPEFNFGLNVNRAVFAAWQEYQGLGLAGGMAHGASLTRELLLWILSAVIPMQFVRNFWTLLMLGLGPVGMYYVAQRFFAHNNSRSSTSASFIAGSFYLFNLATLQYFYPPFETFSSFYGFLPWLIGASLAFLQEGGRRRVVWLIAISVLGTSAFQVQTLFIVYMAVMGVFLLDVLMRGDWQEKRRVFVWLLIQIIVNFYWLFPVGYFTVTQSQTNLQAQQNVLSTPELKVMNQNYGDWQHITAFQGYWFDYLDKDAQFKPAYLLASWRKYLADEKLLWIERGFFLVGVIGIFYLAFERRKRSVSLSLVLLTIGVILVLTAGDGTFGKIYAWASQHVPLFGQIFRTTFTKWSMVMVFLIALGVGFIYLKISSRLVAGLKLLLCGGVMAGMIIVVWPFFQGQLIYDKMKVNLPIEYQHLFQFFDHQPKQARIALLPAQSIWGWEFNDWGYRGSGFLWYGIEQPIVSRTFDIYSPYDENFYHQLALAFHDGSAFKLASVLAKYDVSYVLIDESIALNNPKNVSVSKYSELLVSVGFHQVWKEKFLTVYALDSQPMSFLEPVNGEVELLQLPNLFQAKKLDFIDSRSYAADLPKNVKTKIFPFADLTTNKLKRFIYQDSNLEITSEVFDGSHENYVLSLPALHKGTNFTVPAKISITENVLNIQFSGLAKLSFDQQNRELYKLKDQKISLQQKDISRVVLALNGQTLVIEKGQPLHQIINLTVGEPIELTLSEVSEDSQRKAVFKTGGERSIVLENSIWDELISPQVYQAMVANPLQFKLSMAAEPIDILSKFASTPAGETCDALHRGQVEKKLVAKNALAYEATNAGALCENLEVKGINPQSSYFMQFAGENISGRSVKILFSSLSDNYFYLEQLLDAGTFKDGFVLLPFGEKADRYFLNLELKSFGRDTAITRLDSIQLAELPLSTEILSQIELRPLDYQSVQSTAKMTKPKKWSTWFYSSTVTVDSKVGVVALSQGFDQGWVMLAISGEGQNWPVHFSFKGWANGWLVPEGKYDIFVFYWPQLGVLVGLLILGPGFYVGKHHLAK